MENHRRDHQEANATPTYSQQPENDKLRPEWVEFHAFIREIHRSEEDHQAAQRKLGVAQLRITAIGAIVCAITSLSIIGSLVIAKIASDDAHMALVASNRAWISPVSATLAAIPSAPPSEGIPVLVPFRNAGHEPATDAFIISGSDSIAIEATYDEIHAKERSFEDYCFSVGGVTDDASAVSIVIFPGGSAANDYNGSITIKPDLIDWGVVYGKKYLFLHACVVYQTFGQVRHTSVCYYLQAGKTIGSLPFCDKGNKAD